MWEELKAFYLISARSLSGGCFCAPVSSLRKANGQVLSDRAKAGCAQTRSGPRFGKSAALTSALSLAVFIIGGDHDR